MQPQLWLCVVHFIFEFCHLWCGSTAEFVSAIHFIRRNKINVNATVCTHSNWMTKKLPNFFCAHFAILTSTSIEFSLWNTGTIIFFLRKCSCSFCVFFSNFSIYFWVSVVTSCNWIWFSKTFELKTIEMGAYKERKALYLNWHSLSYQKEKKRTIKFVLVLLLLRNFSLGLSIFHK